MSYDSLVHERVLVPLGMNSTGITPTAEQAARLATGHSNLYWMTPAPSWNFATLAGAGGLRSTANDMLTFLAANLGLIETPLASSMAAMLKVRRDVDDNEKIGLGWFLRKEKGSETVWHNGGTFGYKAFTGYDPKKRLGVVVLSNNSSGASMNDIGRHILNSLIPLNTLGLKNRAPVHIDPQALAAYAGQFQFPNKDVWTVRPDGERLFIKKNGEPEFEAFPQGNHRFFLKVRDAQVTFDFDKADPRQARELILRQVWVNQPQRARLLDQAPTPRD
jgi:hypothetical protein